MNVDHLAPNLRFYRHLRELSQSALAASLGTPFSQTYISQLERGLHPHEACHVGAIARALRISRRRLLERPRSLRSGVMSKSAVAGSSEAA